MRDQERWLKQRRTCIGASDAAAVAGVGKWGSPLSVYLDKIGEGVETEPSERMQLGLLLERPIAEEWCRRVGASDLRRQGFRRHPSIPYIGATPDFEAVHPEDGPVLVECKNSDTRSEWESAEDGDTVPLQYFLQVQHQMIATGHRIAYLVVLIRGNELRSFRIEYDREVAEQMLETYADFWEHVENRIPPEVDGSEATAQALSRMYPTDSGEEIVATIEETSTVEALLEARRDVVAAEERKTLAENRLKVRIGDATRFLFAGGSISWKVNRPTVKTDWQSVAHGYRTLIEDYREDDQDRAGDATTTMLTVDLDVFESIHTSTIAGARPFRVVLTEQE